MLLRIQSEGIHVDTSLRASSVVPVRLQLVEVLAGTLTDSITGVELNLGGTRGTVDRTGSARTIGEVQPVVGRGSRVQLQGPDQFLTRVGEVQLLSHGRVVERFGTQELQLLYKIFVWVATE